MIGELPEQLEVNGISRPIRTDYRDVLRILTAFNDPELEERDKIYVCLCILYVDFYDMDESDYEPAFTAAISFIDQGSASGKKKPTVVDWEQDENLIFPAINRVAGCEVRALKQLHWWTFLGYYMEISEGIFSHVLSLRVKKAKGKKLEKWEQEFWSENKDICLLHPKLSQEEQEEKDRLNKLLG